MRASWRERETPIHPDNETLLAWADCELTEKLRREMTEHLSSCFECRSLLVEMEGTFQQVVVTNALHEATAPLDDKLPQLVAQMSKWKKIKRDTVEALIATRAASELEVFFGNRARAMINDLKFTQQAGSGTLSAVESLFAAFLGSKAAAALTNGIVENLDIGDLLERQCK